MPLRSLALRVLCLLALSVWMGGFTFYSAAVIPILHDRLGSLDAGNVTQQVTDALNGIGVVTLVLWWAAAGVERSTGSARRRRTRLALLSVTTTLLLGLIYLHQVMDSRLETTGLRGFYPLHRVYLIASTVQWVVNVGLLTCFLAGWGTHPAPHRI